MTATAPKKSAPRKAAPRKVPRANGNGNGDGDYVPPTEVTKPPEEFKPVSFHPLYGAKKLYTYQPKDGSPAIELPHITTCTPSPLFFYENRNKNEMYQAFAWMDLSGIPDEIGRRVFSLPQEEQSTVMREWFAGLNLTPQQGVSPPGES